MNQNPILALQILLISMGMLLAAALWIWLLLSGIKRLVMKRKSEMDEDQREQAAALAVAISLASHDEPGISRFPTPPTAIISAWQLSTRTRQMRKDE